MSDTTNTFHAVNVPMKFVHDLHTEMTQNNVILTYEGFFSQEITKSVLAMSERKFDADGLDASVKKKVFNVMVETLQNICKHQFADEDDLKETPAIFMIGLVEGDYLIISGNPLATTKIDNIKNRIDKVNSLDKDGLKALYKEARLASTISDVGGAGLGFIDIARKSGSPLVYSFDHVNDQLSYYTLMVRISSKTDSAE
ncbi:MAG: hypothetical protein RL711_1604 [Bacteroidota bacterium]|jgi:hypothetical protein